MTSRSDGTVSLHTSPSPKYVTFSYMIGRLLEVEVRMLSGATVMELVAPSYSVIVQAQIESVIIILHGLQRTRLRVGRWQSYLR